MFSLPKKMILTLYNNSYNEIQTVTIQNPPPTS